MLPHGHPSRVLAPPGQYHRSDDVHAPEGSPAGRHHCPRPRRRPAGRPPINGMALSVSAETAGQLDVEGVKVDVADVLERSRGGTGWGKGIHLHHRRRSIHVLPAIASSPPVMPQIIHDDKGSYR